MDTSLATAYREHLGVMQSRLEAALTHGGADGAIVLAGSPPTPAWDDQPYPFRAYPPFVQWCPLPDAAGSALVLAPARRPRLILLQPVDFWHAPPRLPDASWTAHFDIDVITSTEARDKLLHDCGSRYAVIGEPPAPVTEPAKTTASLDISRLLEFDRARKTRYEIACIAAANRIAAAGHLAVEAPFTAGEAELAIDHAYIEASRQRTTGLPYPSIVALNDHAAILHYQHLDDRAPSKSNTLLIDAGARFFGYAADITRTHLASDSPLTDLHDSMEALQQTLCNDARAGVEFTALNERAHALLAAVLVDHGLVRCGTEEAFARGLTRVFLPHGLGHLLGLQVHDVGGRQREALAQPTAPPPEHPFLRLTRRLEPGFVLTIEPGIYFIEALYRSLPASERALIDEAEFERLLAHGGIRIEDDVAIEAGDNINLTRAAFAGNNPGRLSDSPDADDRGP